MAEYWSSGMMTVSGGQVVDTAMMSGDGRELGDQVLPFISVFVPTRLRHWFVVIR